LVEFIYLFNPNKNKIKLCTKNKKKFCTKKIKKLNFVPRKKPVLSHYCPLSTSPPPPRVSYSYSNSTNPMATLESAITVFTPQRFSNNYYHFLAKSPDSVKLLASTSIPSSSSSLFSHFSSSSSKSRTLCFALQEVTEAAIEDDKTEPLNNVKKKLCVFNLPWTQSAPDINDLFAQCGTVISVEVVSKSLCSVCFIFSI
jgi:hypothetical protein